jgi:hypothetical protein
MSEKTLINGWTISHGDYLRDPEYDEGFIKTKANKKVIERVAFSVGAVLAFGGFFGLMTLFVNLTK